MHLLFIVEGDLATLILSDMDLLDMTDKTSMIGEWRNMLLQSTTGLPHALC